MFPHRSSHAIEVVTASTPMQEPSIVHSSHGRLRIHLPHWEGTQSERIVAELCRLCGVTSAEANPLTGNVLIRFEPLRTSIATLVEALPAVRLEPAENPLLPYAECGRPPGFLKERSTLTTVREQPIEERESGEGAYVTGFSKVVYQALGWGSVGMAVVGFLVPGIPGAPFVILAGYFFIRSSPEAHQWLRRSRWFGPILRDWETHHGVRPLIRNAALVLIGASMVFTILLPLPALLKVTIVAFQSLGIGLMLQLRVVEPVVSGLPHQAM
jgi:uncharacterized protein